MSAQENRQNMFRTSRQVLLPAHLLDAEEQRSHPIPKRSLAAILIIVTCLSICICFISGNLNARFQHRSETIHNQFAILKGDSHIIDGVEKTFPQFQSRVLFPLLLTAVRRASVLSESQWYLILRIATAFVAFSTFLLLCIKIEGMPLKTAIFGVGALAYALVFTFNHGWEHPTDFLDVAFFSGFIWLTLQKRRFPLALLTLLGTLNHQTAAFAGIIWFCVWGAESWFEPKWREIAYAATLAVGSYSVSTAVRVSFGAHKASDYAIPQLIEAMRHFTASTDSFSDGWLTIPQFREALRHPQPFSWPLLLLAMVLPVSLWLWSNRSVTTGYIRRLIWAASLMIVISSPIAYWSELRSVFLAPIVVVSFAAAASEHKMQRTIPAGWALDSLGQSR